MPQVIGACPRMAWDLTEYRRDTRSIQEKIESPLPSYTYHDKVFIRLLIGVLLSLPVNPILLYQDQYLQRFFYIQCRKTYPRYSNQATQLSYRISRDQFIERKKFDSEFQNLINK